MLAWVKVERVEIAASRFFLTSAPRLPAVGVTGKAASAKYGVSALITSRSAGTFAAASSSRQPARASVQVAVVSAGAAGARELTVASRLSSLAARALV